MSQVKSIPVKMVDRSIKEIRAELKLIKASHKAARGEERTKLRNRLSELDLELYLASNKWFAVF